MEGDRVGTLVVGYSSCSQIPIDGGINSTQSQWAPARRSLGEHINQGSPCLGQNIHRSCQLYFSDMLMCISQICSCVFLWFCISLFLKTEYILRFPHKEGQEKNTQTIIGLLAWDKTFTNVVKTSHSSCFSS